ncbi:MAG: HipA family kinase [Planctomycetota bacterium]
MRTVSVTRYVTPLREGGSMPAIVEADDDGTYVLKFRGAGQGPRALIAELIAGALAEALGLRLPERVFADLDTTLARTEGDPEVQALIQASGGRNLALDYLPGAANFDPLADPVDERLASEIVWFDAFISNVDRTARNTNLMMWHDALWLIDHGAAFYFHHNWDGGTQRATAPFAHIREHVLLPTATALEAADAALAPRLSEALFQETLARVPDEWLAAPGAFADPATQRAAYVAYLTRRLAGRAAFVQEALRARAS